MTGQQQHDGIGMEGPELADKGQMVGRSPAHQPSCSLRRSCALRRADNSCPSRLVTNESWSVCAPPNGTLSAKSSTRTSVLSDLVGSMSADRVAPLVHRVAVAEAPWCLGAPARWAVGLPAGPPRPRFAPPAGRCAERSRGVPAHAGFGGALSLSKCPWRGGRATSLPSPWASRR